MRRSARRRRAKEKRRHNQQPAAEWITLWEPKWTGFDTRIYKGLLGLLGMVRQAEALAMFQEDDPELQNAGQNTGPVQDAGLQD